MQIQSGMEPNKIKILSTKNLRKETLAEAAASGLKIEELSFIETVSLDNSELRRQVNAIADKYASIIFTSSKAVEAVAKLVGNKENQWRFYCTSPQTLKTVIDHFSEERIAASASNATELAQVIIADRPGNPLVFFCGDRSREELPGLLERENIELRKLVVYETRLSPAAIQKNYEAVLFFSPTAVESFFSVNQLSEQTVLFAIGETTAAALREASSNEVIVADHPSEEWMTKKIIERFLVRN